MVCSAVAVIAIFIFLIALFNGALLSKEKALVDVPYLEGSVYDESLASQYPDFTIKLQQQYDDTRPKGEILHTEPSGGSRAFSSVPTARTARSKKSAFRCQKVVRSMVK